MEDALRSFDKRQRALRRKHTRMARGYVNKVDRTGLIVQRPDKKAGGRLLKVLMFLGICALGFKTLLLAGLGETEYLDRVASLNGGTVYEQAGAWVMQIDPVTRGMADVVAPLLESETVKNLTAPTSEKSV